MPKNTNEQPEDLGRRGFLTKALTIGGSTLASMAVVKGADELLKRKIENAREKITQQDTEASLGDIVMSLEEIKAHNESVGSKIDSISSLADTLIDIYTAIKTVDQEQGITRINEKLDMLQARVALGEGEEVTGRLGRIEEILTNPDVGVGELREGLIVMHDLLTDDLERNTKINEGQDREIAELRRENRDLQSKITADHEENLRQSEEIASLKAGQERMTALLEQLVSGQK